MNIPNQLTTGRFFLSVLLMICLSCSFPFAFSAALLIFVLASLTDALDGWLARNRYGTTDFGKLMDPLADKVLTCAAFISFVALEFMPAWMAVLIISREFMVTGLRLLAAGKGNVISAGASGKFKTIFQMIYISVQLLIPALKEFGLTLEWLEIPALLLLWITLLLTVYSGAEYFWKQRETVFEDC